MIKKSKPTFTVEEIKINTWILLLCILKCLFQMLENWQLNMTERHSIILWILFSRKSCLWCVCSGIIFFGVMPMVFGSNGTFNPNKYGVVGLKKKKIGWLVRFEIQVPWSMWVTCQLKNNYNFLYCDNLLNGIFLFLLSLLWLPKSII